MNTTRKPAYHPLKRQFRSDALADFCAVYYSTITSFGHWSDLSSNNYRLLQTHWRNQNYQAAVRLFWARQKIERAFHLAGFGNLVRLGMFYGSELARFQDEPFHGQVIDFWRRPWKGKIELMLADPSRAQQVHVACDLDKIKDALDIRKTGDIDDVLFAHMNRLSVRLDRYKSIRYISRVWIHVANTHVSFRTEPFGLSRLHFMLHSPEFASEMSASLCVSQGNLEFSPYLLFEAPNENSISELNMFTVESVLVDKLVDRDTTLAVNQKRINCVDFNNVCWTYVGPFRCLHRFKRGDCIRLLVKRPWGSPEAFILSAELISENELLDDSAKAQLNDQAFRREFELLPLGAFLDELPNDGDLLPIGSLSVGQEIEHPEYGRGIIVAREPWHGREELKVRFYREERRHPTGVHVFDPEYQVESFWTNLKLTGVNPDG